MALRWNYSIANELGLYSAYQIELQCSKISLNKDLCKSLKLRLWNFEKALHRGQTIGLAYATI